MGLIYPDRFEVDPKEEADEIARKAFLAGIKAAFLVGQLNRLGQILCSSCGRTRTDLASAFNESEVVPLVDDGLGYRGGFELGADHPNNLILRCWRCSEKSKTADLGADLARQ